MRIPKPGNKPRHNAIQRFITYPGRVMALLGRVGETTMLVIEASDKGQATLCLGRIEQSLALDDLETLCLAGLEFIKEQRENACNGSANDNDNDQIGVQSAKVSVQGATHEPGQSA